MVNAFELITDIVQVINARPNKAKNSYYKALDSRTGMNGKIPLVRISNHKTHCITWLGDIRDLGTAMRFPANYYFSIVIENEPSQKDENVPVRVRPFTVHEYTFKQEESEESDIHTIIQDVKGIFTTGEFANSTGKGKYDPVNAKVVQQAQPTTNNETNESKNMNKKNIIRLTESDLKRVIAESVKNIISELDWKTYANAAKKAYNKGEDRYRDFQKAAEDEFQKTHGHYVKTDNGGFEDVHLSAHPGERGGVVANQQILSNSPYAKPVTRNHAYRMSGGNQVASTHSGDIHLPGAHSKYHNDGSSKQAYTQHFAGNNMKSVYEKADNEAENYYNHNYEYIKGWHLKDGRK